MPEFNWQAASPDGQVLQGSFQAANSAAALKKVQEMGLTPIGVRESGDAAARAAGSANPSNPGVGGQRPKLWQPSGTQSKAPVNAKDVLSLTSELAIMLRAGLSLDNALRILGGMRHKPAVAHLVQSILDDVKGGAPLSRSLSKHPTLFSDFYTNMIRSGEASGQIAKVMDRLVEHMERLRALRENVISATIYPFILLVVAVISLVAMLGFVVPQFEKLFTDLGDALPAPTRLVMQLGHLFTDYGFVLAVGAAAGVLAAAKWLKSAGGKRWWQKRVLSIPLLGRLTLKYELTLFARSLGTLLGNGVPLLTSLRIATETVGNISLRSALEKVPPSVKDGGKIADALQATGIFDTLSLNLIRVGEETGRTGTMMLEIANILNQEVETGIKRALTLLEPVLIVVLGLMIASIIVSILMGILSINDLAV